METAAAVEIQKGGLRQHFLDGFPPLLEKAVARTARNQVYGFTGDGTKESPAIVSDAYSVQAREMAYSRAALAGYRLAEFLNQRLK